jgi:hypothetical protein
MAFSRFKKEYEAFNLSQKGILLWGEIIILIIIIKS